MKEMVKFPAILMNSGLETLCQTVIHIIYWLDLNMHERFEHKLKILLEENVYLADCCEKTENMAEGGD